MGREVKKSRCSFHFHPLWPTGDSLAGTPELVTREKQGQLPSVGHLLRKLGGGVSWERANQSGRNKGKNVRDETRGAQEEYTFLVVGSFFHLAPGKRLPFSETVGLCLIGVRVGKLL